MLLAIDKPTGITSYDVIRRLKHLYPKKKIGHSGTLDPLATGLLIIGVGNGTKQLTQIQGQDKSYRTTIDFSQSSDTRDVDYRDRITQYDLIKNGEKIVGIEKDGIKIIAPNIEMIQEKLDSLIPEKELPLTPFSAKKKDGKKLYELARSGQVLTENRVMKVMKVSTIDYKFPLVELSMDVGSGTYIRSIGYRLGQQFDLGGILTQLRRTRIGNVDLENLKLEKLGDTELMGAEIELSGK